MENQTTQLLEKLGATVIMSIIIMVSFFSIPSVVNGLFHPEYWALKEILNYISK